MLENCNSLCEKRQKVIVSKDRHAKPEHRGINRDECTVRHYRIDGDVIASKAVKKCDYLLLNDDKYQAYLIELKGTSLLDAIEQLENTEQILKQDLSGFEKNFRIVYRSNTHAVHSIDYNKFYKRKKGKVRAATDRIEDVI